MKLSIVIAHHNEPWEVVKPLFDSLAMQRGIDWRDIEVLLIQDGEEGTLEKDRFICYNLPVVMYVLPNGGVSKARNHGIDASKGEYVMMCDCDDVFHSAYGLHLVFSAMEGEPDIINSGFIEESRVDGGYHMFAHDGDITFVHGKAFRKEFLDHEVLRFPEHIKKHEDGAMIGLAFQLTQKVKYIKTPFYTWVWNPGSVMRRDGVSEALLLSYDELMNARVAFIEGIKIRRPDTDIGRHVAMTVFTAYYDFQREVFNKPENAADAKKAGLAFKGFYERYKDEYLKNDSKVLSELAQKARTTAYNNGMIMERMTIGQFLNMISGLNGKTR